MMCQHFSEHTVKQLYAAIHSQRATNSYWRNGAVLTNKQYDAVEKLDFESRMNKALACWQSAWDNMPEEWIELNDDTQCFDPEKHLQRLSNEANGDIWLKLP